METIEDVRNQPQNVVRKMGALWHCMIDLERFRMSHRPIFEGDPDIAILQDILQTAYAKLLMTLHEYPNFMQYIYDYWKE